MELAFHHEWADGVNAAIEVSILVLMELAFHLGMDRYEKEVYARFNPCFNGISFSSLDPGFDIIGPLVFQSLF